MDKGLSRSLPFLPRYHSVSPARTPRRYSSTRSLSQPSQRIIYIEGQRSRLSNHYVQLPPTTSPRNSSPFSTLSTPPPKQKPVKVILLNTKFNSPLYRTSKSNSWNDLNSSHVYSTFEPLHHRQKRFEKPEVVAAASSCDDIYHKGPYFPDASHSESGISMGESEEEGSREQGGYDTDTGSQFSYGSSSAFFETTMDSEFDRGESSDNDTVFSDGKLSPAVWGGRMGPGRSGGSSSSSYAEARRRELMSSSPSWEFDKSSPKHSHHTHNTTLKISIPEESKDQHNKRSTGGDGGGDGGGGGGGVPPTPLAQSTPHVSPRSFYGPPMLLSIKGSSWNADSPRSDVGDDTMNSSRAASSLSEHYDSTTSCEEYDVSDSSSTSTTKIKLTKKASDRPAHKHGIFILSSQNKNAEPKAARGPDNLDMCIPPLESVIGLEYESNSMAKSDDGDDGGGGGEDTPRAGQWWAVYNIESAKARKNAAAGDTELPDFDVFGGSRGEVKIIKPVKTGIPLISAAGKMAKDKLKKSSSSPPSTPKGRGDDDCKGFVSRRRSQTHPLGSGDCKNNYDSMSRRKSLPLLSLSPTLVERIANNKEKIPNSKDSIYADEIPKVGAEQINEKGRELYKMRHDEDRFCNDVGNLPSCISKEPMQSEEGGSLFQFQVTNDFDRLTAHPSSTNVHTTTTTTDLSVVGVGSNGGDLQSHGHQNNTTSPPAIAAAVVDGGSRCNDGVDQASMTIPMTTTTATTNNQHYPLGNYTDISMIRGGWRHQQTQQTGERETIEGRNEVRDDCKGEEIIVSTTATATSTNNQQYLQPRLLQWGRGRNNEQVEEGGLGGIGMENKFGGRGDGGGGDGGVGTIIDNDLANDLPVQDHKTVESTRLSFHQCESTNPHNSKPVDSDGCSSCDIVSLVNNNDDKDDDNRFSVDLNLNLNQLELHDNGRHGKSYNRCVSVDVVDSPRVVDLCHEFEALSLNGDAVGTDPDATLVLVDEVSDVDQTLSKVEWTPQRRGLAVIVDNDDDNNSNEKYVNINIDKTGSKNTTRKGSLVLKTENVDKNVSFLSGSVDQENNDAQQIPPTKATGENSVDMIRGRIIGNHDTHVTSSCLVCHRGAGESLETMERVGGCDGCCMRHDNRSNSIDRYSSTPIAHALIHPTIEHGLSGQTRMTDDGENRIRGIENQYEIRHVKVVATAEKIPRVSGNDGNKTDRVIDEVELFDLGDNKISLSHPANNHGDKISVTFSTRPIHSGIDRDGDSHATQRESLYDDQSKLSSCSGDEQLGSYDDALMPETRRGECHSNNDNYYKDGGDNDNGDSDYTNHSRQAPAVNDGNVSSHGMDNCGHSYSYNHNHHDQQLQSDDALLWHQEMLSQDYYDDVGVKCSSGGGGGGGDRSINTSFNNYYDDGGGGDGGCERAGEEEEGGRYKGIPHLQLKVKEESINKTTAQKDGKEEGGNIATEEAIDGAQWRQTDNNTGDFLLHLQQGGGGGLLGLSSSFGDRPSPVTADSLNQRVNNNNSSSSSNINTNTTRIVKQIHRKTVEETVTIERSVSTQQRPTHCPDTSGNGDYYCAAVNRGGRDIKDGRVLDYVKSSTNRKETVVEEKVDYISSAPNSVESNNFSFCDFKNDEDDKGCEFVSRDINANCPDINQANDAERSASTLLSNEALNLPFSVIEQNSECPTYYTDNIAKPNNKHILEDNNISSRPEFKDDISKGTMRGNNVLDTLQAQLSNISNGVNNCGDNLTHPNGSTKMGHLDGNRYNDRGQAVANDVSKHNDVLRGDRGGVPGISLHDSNNLLQHITTSITPQYNNNGMNNDRVSIQMNGGNSDGGRSKGQMSPDMGGRVTGGAANGNHKPSENYDNDYDYVISNSNLDVHSNPSRHNHHNLVLLKPGHAKSSSLWTLQEETESLLDGLSSPKQTTSPTRHFHSFALTNDSEDSNRHGQQDINSNFPPPPREFMDVDENKNIYSSRSMTSACHGQRKPFSDSSSLDYNSESGGNCSLRNTNNNSDSAHHSTSTGNEPGGVQSLSDIETALHALSGPPQFNYSHQSIESPSTTHVSSPTPGTNNSFCDFVSGLESGGFTFDLSNKSHLAPTVNDSNQITRSSSDARHNQQQFVQSIIVPGHACTQQQYKLSALGINNNSSDKSFSHLQPGKQNYSSPFSSNNEELMNSSIASSSNLSSNQDVQSEASSRLQTLDLDLSRISSCTSPTPSDFSEGSSAYTCTGTAEIKRIVSISFDDDYDMLPAPSTKAVPPSSTPRKQQTTKLKSALKKSKPFENNNNTIKQSSSPPLSSKHDDWVKQFDQIIEDFNNKTSRLGPNPEFTIIEDKRDKQTGENETYPGDNLYNSFTNDDVEKKQNHVCIVDEPEDVTTFRFKRFLKKSHTRRNTRGKRIVRFLSRLSCVSESVHPSSPEHSTSNNDAACKKKARLGNGNAYTTDSSPLPADREPVVLATSCASTAYRLAHHDYPHRSVSPTHITATGNNNNNNETSPASSIQSLDSLRSRTDSAYSSVSESVALNLNNSPQSQKITNNNNNIIKHNYNPNHNQLFSTSTPLSPKIYIGDASINTPSTTLLSHPDSAFSSISESDLTRCSNSNPFSTSSLPEEQPCDYSSDMLSALSDVFDQLDVCEEEIDHAILNRLRYSHQPTTPHNRNN